MVKEYSFEGIFSQGKDVGYGVRGSGCMVRSTSGAGRLPSSSCPPTTPAFLLVPPNHPFLSPRTPLPPLPSSSCPPTTPAFLPVLPYHPCLPPRAPLPPLISSSCPPTTPSFLPVPPYQLQPLLQQGQLVLELGASLYKHLPCISIQLALCSSSSSVGMGMGGGGWGGSVPCAAATAVVCGGTACPV